MKLFAQTVIHFLACQMADAPTPPSPAPAPAPEPKDGETRKAYVMSPNLPFLKKLNAIKTPEERLALINQLRNQLEQAEKERGAFGEQLRKMHAKDAFLAAKNLQSTLAAATNGNLEAAAMAVKMASIKPEDQRLALKHLESMDAANLTTHKLMTLSMIEQNTHKLILNQLALHMENLTAAVQVIAMYNKALFNVLGISLEEANGSTTPTATNGQQESTPEKQVQKENTTNEAQNAAAP